MHLRASPISLNIAETTAAKSSCEGRATEGGQAHAAAAASVAQN